MQIVQQNESDAAERRIFLFVVDATDGITGEGGEAGGTAEIVLPGATALVDAGTLNGIGTIGHYFVEPVQASFGTLGISRLRYKSTAAAEAFADIQVVAYDPFDGSAFGLARLDDTISSRQPSGAVNLNADQSAVTIGTVDELAQNNDKTGYALVADSSAVTIGTANNVGTVGTLGIQAKADINAEVLNVVGTVSIAELGVSAPTATPSLTEAVMWFYMDARNKVTQTGTLRTVSNDVGTTIAKATLADTGTTFTKDEYVSG